MKNRIRTILFLIIILPLFANASPGLGHKMTEIKKPWKAPAFSLQNMDEEHVSLQQFNGKVVLVNFWATWCPPCRKEMPSLERLYQQLKSDNFSMLAINQWESPDHVFAYVGQLSVDPTFPILFDRESKVAESYKVIGLPTTLLIDKQGRVRYKAVGGREFDHPEVITIIRQLMAE